jgi:hypothetical protein
LNFNALYQLNGLGQQLDSAEAVMTGATLKALNPVIANAERAAGVNSNPGNYNNFITWQVGWTFQAPLGMRAPLANTRQSQYTLLRARAYLQQVVHQTTHSLARFFLEIDANYKQFKTASRLRAAAAQRLDAQRAYYEEGRITIDRFLDAVSQYATAVATEAQYKTTYNISIVALEEAKGTLLAYDNIAVAEGPHPRKAYIQARDIQDAHRQLPISPDGSQVPRTPSGPMNSDPVIPNPPPNAGDYRNVAPMPGPAGTLDPRPAPLAPYVPASLLPDLSQASPKGDPLRPIINRSAAPKPDVNLTSGASSSDGARTASAAITPAPPSTRPTLGATAPAQSSPPAAAEPLPIRPAVTQQPPRVPVAVPAAGPAIPQSAPAEDLPPLPAIELPPLPPK